MSEKQEHSLKGYWIAWAILLVVTLGMVFVQNPFVLLAGIALKATIIAMWYMHLKYEPIAMILSVSLGLLFTGVLLFALIAPDGLAM